MECGSRNPNRRFTSSCRGAVADSHSHLVARSRPYGVIYPQQSIGAGHLPMPAHLRFYSHKPRFLIVFYRVELLHTRNNGPQVPIAVALERTGSEGERLLH